MAGRNRSEGMGCSGRRLAALAILSLTMQETCCLPSPSLTQSSRMGRGGLFIPGGSMKALPGLLRRQARSGMRGGHTQGGQVVEGSRLKRLAAILEVLASLFPLWVVVAVLAAIFKPETVTWLQGNSITVAVGATMVFTGMTLTIDDFVRILKDPAQVSMGCLCQYTLMPILGVFISKFLKLPKDIAAGLILLSSCPGGTSSNLITLIAKGDVALSVLMTTASTLLAAIATPSLVAMNAGSLVKIDPIGLVISTMQVVLGPVACGLAVHHLFPHSAAMAKIFTPFISVIMVSLICGSIIGQTASAALAAGPTVLISVILLHSCGFLFGWIVPKLLGYSESVARTCAIETGIQSSAFAVVLATRHFPNPILTALPCALSGTVQSMLGSLMAIVWSHLPV
uniref:Uncharacterized protein n=1 Tax=Guillardia theta TaxID=55529 RepID=A0A7S4KWW9_GUITH|mmetsp:Transcript_32718/g.103557  ORF Transcript_32718/g.103557 Transcript_32718/m.103557 type:complete len:398 (+) Transcript_32718:286-1479(+)